jgi:hypothetical protein
MPKLDFSFMDDLRQKAPEVNDHAKEREKEAAAIKREFARIEAEEEAEAEMKKNDPRQKALRLARRGADIFQIVEALAAACKKGGGQWYDDFRGVMLSNYGMGQNQPRPLLYEIKALKSSITALRNKLKRKDIPQWSKNQIGDMIRGKESDLRKLESSLDAQGKSSIEDRLQAMDYLRAAADRLKAELEADTGQSLDDLRQSLASGKRKQAMETDETAAQDAEPIPVVEEYSLVDESTHEDAPTKEDYPL